MQPDNQTIAAADARFTEWMRRNLDHAARHFGLSITGEPVFGWRLRTIGAPATGPDGPRWLRVVTEFPEWATGDSWTGNTDAGAITDIRKPRVLGVLEWDEQNWRRQRAEVATLLPGAAISPTNQLQAAVELPNSWWAELRRSIDILRATLTGRTYTNQVRVSERAQAAYGHDLTIAEWETVHGDLHWENLLGPQFGLLDWELWGYGPAGTDAATLLLDSLLVPQVAEKVHDSFADPTRHRHWPQRAAGRRRPLARTDRRRRLPRTGRTATAACPRPRRDVHQPLTGPLPVVGYATAVRGAGAGAGRPARWLARRPTGRTALWVAHVRHARRLAGGEVRG